MVSGLINLSSEIPDDLMDTSSKLSPRLPKVMIEEISIAIGIASISKEALAYQRNLQIVKRSRSLPTRSSMYFHRLCIISINNAIKKVITNGPIKDLKTSLSNFFIIQPAGQLFKSYVYIVSTMAMDTKIALSDKELEMVCNTDWILTKHAIIQKVYKLFGEMLPLFEKTVNENKKYLPAEVFINSPKISKGENYKLLPYVMLDYPRYFGNSRRIKASYFKHT